MEYARPMAMIPLDSESETDGGTERREPTARDLGKRVTCQVACNSSSKKKEKSGTLRYYGRPEFASGVWCGVELDDPEGKNNGSVQGIRYFSCLPNHGIFLQLNRVELEPFSKKVRGKIRPGSNSLERQLNGFTGGSNMSRSSSVSALSKIGPSGFCDQPKKYSTPGLHVSPGHIKPANKTSRKYLGSIQPSSDSSLKKYSSELNIHTTTPSSSPVRKLPSSRQQRQYRTSCSEPPKESSQIRSYKSVQDLTLQRKPSPGGSSLVSSLASTPRSQRNDSTSDFSYICSSSANSSGSDRTPRSSSVSPFNDDDDDNGLSSTLTAESLKHHLRKSLPPDVFEQNPDDAFLASPPEPKLSLQAITRLVPLPKGLATPVSTFLENAHKHGQRSGDCQVQSPEHHSNTRQGQSASTTTHPLLNGHIATYSDGSDTATTEREDTKRSTRRRTRSRHIPTASSVFVCPNSGQEISLVNGITTDNSEGDVVKTLQSQLMHYSKQQAKLEKRMMKMEESIEQMKGKFEMTLKEIQEAHKQQIENIHLQYAQEMNMLHKPSILEEIDSDR